MASFLTLEEYLEQRDDLLDEGRWHDLVQGELVAREQPSDQQGVAILNLTRQLGSYFQKTAQQQTSYACFELGLVLSREPDSVRFPAISVFRGGNRFEHLDDVTTENRPALVIDHALGTTDNSGLAQEYLAADIQTVWLLDSHNSSIEVYSSDQSDTQTHETKQLTPEAEWPGLQIDVPQLFTPPE